MGNKDLKDPKEKMELPVRTVKLVHRDPKARTELPGKMVAQDLKDLKEKKGTQASQDQRDLREKTGPLARMVIPGLKEKLDLKAPRAKMVQRVKMGPLVHRVLLVKRGTQASLVLKVLKETMEPQEKMALLDPTDLRDPKARTDTRAKTGHPVPMELQEKTAFPVQWALKALKVPTVRPAKTEEPVAMANSDHKVLKALQDSPVPLVRMDSLDHRVRLVPQPRHTPPQLSTLPPSTPVPTDITKSESIVNLIVQYFHCFVAWSFLNAISNKLS